MVSVIFMFVIETGGAENGVHSCTAVLKSLFMDTIVNIDEKFYDSDKEEKP